MSDSEAESKSKNSDSNDNESEENSENSDTESENNSEETDKNNVPIIKKFENLTITPANNDAKINIVPKEDTSTLSLLLRIKGVNSNLDKISTNLTCAVERFNKNTKFINNSQINQDFLYKNNQNNNFDNNQYNNNCNNINILFLIIDQLNIINFKLNFYYLFIYIFNQYK